MHSTYATVQSTYFYNSNIPLVRVFTVVVGYMVGFKNQPITTKQNTTIASLPQGFAGSRTSQFVKFESNSGSLTRYVFTVANRASGATIAVTRMENSTNISNFNSDTFVYMSNESFT